MTQEDEATERSADSAYSVGPLRNYAVLEIRDPPYGFRLDFERPFLRRVAFIIRELPRLIRNAWRDSRFE